MKKKDSSLERSRNRLRSDLEAALAPRALKRFFAGASVQESPPGTSSSAWARIMLITEGRQAMGISWRGRRRDIVLRRGHLLYLCPNALWQPCYDSDYTVFGLVFTPDYVRFLINRHRAVEGHRAAQCWYHTSGPLRRAVQRVVLTLNELVGQGHDDGTIDDLLRALLRLLLDQLRTDRPAPRGKARATWQAVCEHVRDHASGAMDRKSVARAFGLHPNHVSRLFAQFGPEGFNLFVRRMRMERAAAFLLQTPEKVEAVSVECGYTSSTYFISQFHEFFGVTPGQYRARAGAFPAP